MKYFETVVKHLAEKKYSSYMQGSINESACIAQWVSCVAFIYNLPEDSVWKYVNEKYKIYFKV